MEIPDEMLKEIRESGYDQELVFTQIRKLLDSDKPNKENEYNLELIDDSTVVILSLQYQTTFTERMTTFISTIVTCFRQLLEKFMKLKLAMMMLFFGETDPR